MPTELRRPAEEDGWRHPAGYRWLVVCLPLDGSQEWVIDGAADEASAVAKARKWSDRAHNEWPNDFVFGVAEATS